MRTNPNSIFKSGSTTYYYSSLFFSGNVRKDIFTLYAFVRTADDYVDSIPQDSAGFYKFKEDAIECIEKGIRSDNSIISEYADLCKRKDFELKWTISFLNSMEQDLKKKSYETIAELDEYIYGSADVIGLMISKIIGIKPEYYAGAKILGASMQLINFIRDINEDISLGRTYIPKEVYKKHGLEKITFEEAKNNNKGFANTVREEIARYISLRNDAHRYFKGIPYRQRIAIKTASDLYLWTARKIYANPMIVFERKIKPTKTKVILTGIKNIFASIFI